MVAALEDAIGILRAAGGVAVLAHPWGRGSRLTLERFGELKAAGLQGIEVDHVEHDAQVRRELRQIAHDLDLVATGSSDSHGERKPNRLGCHTTAKHDYERLKGLWTAPAAIAPGLSPESFTN